MNKFVNASNLVVQNYTPLYVAVIDPFETRYRKSAGFWRLRRNRNRPRRVSRKPVMTRTHRALKQAG